MNRQGNGLTFQGPLSGMVAYVSRNDTADTMARIENVVDSFESRKRKARSTHENSPAPAIVTPTPSPKKIRRSKATDDKLKEECDSSSSCDVPGATELGYGEAGGHDCHDTSSDVPGPSALGYGDDGAVDETQKSSSSVPSDKKLYGEGTQLSTTVPSLKSALRAQLHMPPRPGMFKKRCSVTRYSLQAKQKNLTVVDAATKALEKLREVHENDGEDSIWYSVCHSNK